MKTALFSTVHPAAAPYVADFLRSVAAQEDRDFTLWLAFDLIEPAHFQEALTPFSDLQVVLSDNDTPASLRQRALEHLLPTCDAVIFVDSDDVLYPSRVREAKLGLQDCDVYGCPLELIAQNGERLHRCLSAPEQDWTAAMPYTNVFGLSNTAYRTSIFEHLLPVPTEVTLVDWFFATRAYLSGARLSFGSTPQMAYRQYPNNTARILPPFSPAYIARAAQLVLGHLRTVINYPHEAPELSLEPFEARLRDVERFATAMQGERLETYTDALNARPQEVYLWWEYVAHKELSYLWNT